MQNLSSLFAAALALAASSSLALADQVTDPGAAVPEARYESAFDDYASMTEPKKKDWREANAEASGGGHAGHGMHSDHDMGGMQDGEMDHSMHGGKMDHSMHGEGMDHSMHGDDQTQKQQSHEHHH